MKKATFYDAITETIGEEPAGQLRARLASKFEEECINVEIKCRLRFPLQPAARVAWGVILLKNRASIRASGEDKDRFLAATDIPPGKAKAKTAKAKTPQT